MAELPSLPSNSTPCGQDVNYPILWPSKEAKEAQEAAAASVQRRGGKSSLADVLADEDRRDVYMRAPVEESMWNKLALKCMLCTRAAGKDIVFDCQSDKQAHKYIDIHENGNKGKNTTTQTQMKHQRNLTKLRSGSIKLEERPGPAPAAVKLEQPDDTPCFFSGDKFGLSCHCQVTTLELSRGPKCDDKYKFIKTAREPTSGHWIESASFFTQALTLTAVA